MGRRLYLLSALDLSNAAKKEVYGGAHADTFWVRGDLAPDGRGAVCGSSGGPVEVWREPAAEPHLRLDGHDGEVSVALWGPNEQLLTVGDDCHCRVWNLRRHNVNSHSD